MIIETTPDLSNPHREPCAGCGEETAEGSPLFFDRHVLDDPEIGRQFVCSICVARARRRPHGPLKGNPPDGLSVSALGAVFIK